MGETQEGKAHKKTKAQRPPCSLCILTEGDMEIIGQQMDETIEDIWEKETKKQEEHHKEMQDQ
jgi:hypothetical protein